MPVTTTSDHDQPVTLPTVRAGLFDPPGQLAHLRETSPIRRLVCPDGSLGWLVSSYELARTVLGDTRFSAVPNAFRRRPVDTADAITAHAFLESEQDSSVVASRVGGFIHMDAPEHTRFRRLLAGHFTMRKMNQLRSRIEERTRTQLDLMAQLGSPVDLVESFALPIPLATICDLLGVPDAHHATMHRYVAALEDPEAGPQVVAAALQEFGELLRTVVRERQVRPADDLISTMIDGGDLTEDELVGVSILLAIGGQHTTSNMLALGTFALVHDRRRWDALRADPALIGNAVEELLRYLTVFQLGAFTRAAKENVELGGVPVAAGETVYVSLQAANRDPAKFGDPDLLDLARDAGGHLAFGHGIHQCIGQHLARAEMQIAFAGLIERFPTLQVAVPAEDVPMHPGDIDVCGPYRLPVSW
ncbi:cytochrome P450 [Pseudonocardia sp. GCM10023141]|uniref:cytochrome P450 n=1 Tax=Pseudonocardia sp. GCM10023141 TaxID=3252653 RepID=UPI00360BEE85